MTLETRPTVRKQLIPADSHESGLVLSRNRKKVA